MLFSSLIFIYLFLPLMLLLYIPIKNVTYRNVILLIVSLFFYSWGEPIYILLMVFSIFNDYLHALFIDKFKKKGRNDIARKILISSIIINLGLLGIFKYTDFLIENINAILRFDISLKNIALPLGISFYTFQTMSYSIDVYRGNVKAQRNLLIVATYITMFPQLIAGPIVRYIDIENDLKDRKVTIELFTKGVRRFLIGLGKKVIISNNVALIAVLIIDQDSYNDMGMLLAWIGIISYALQIYFDFSGYSDMAIGLGHMFGFDYLENFNYPYTSNSITDFWRRWHMSLGTWFREYVYIPLGGNRVSKPKAYRNIIIVWFLTGLWHGASWNFVLWGLYFSAILILEKNFLLPKLKDKKIIPHIYAIILILIGWVLFRIENISDILSYYYNMFDITNIGNIDIIRSSKLTYIVIFLILGIIGSTNVLSQLFNKWSEKGPKYETLYNIYTFVILLICTMYLLSDTYNPFIYFNF